MGGREVGAGYEELDTDFADKEMAVAHSAEFEGIASKGGVDGIEVEVVERYRVVEGIGLERGGVGEVGGAGFVDCKIDQDTLRVSF